MRYRTETRTDSEGNSYTVEVPYNYYILNVALTSKPISSVASELLTPINWRCIRCTGRRWATSR